MQQSIAFYNLENFFDTVDDPNTNDDDFLPNGYKNWTELRYLKKLENISASIASIPNGLPALIGVAEIENKTVLTDLIYQAEFKRDYDYIHFDSKDRRGIDVALLFNRQHFTPIHKEKLKVHLNGNPNYITRDILYVKGELLGDVVHIFVNHWPSRGEGTLKSMPNRIAAAQSLSKKAKSILDLDENAKIIIMGDFNDLPVSKSITQHLKAKSNLDLRKYEFYNLAAIPYQNKEGTLFAQKRWLMFDQIIISNGMIKAKGIKITANRLQIHHDKSLLYYDTQRGIYKPNRTYARDKYYGGSSDHLPVYVAIDIEN